MENVLAKLLRRSLEARRQSSFHFTTRKRRARMKIGNITVWIVLLQFFAIALAQTNTTSVCDDDQFVCADGSLVSRDASKNCTFALCVDGTISNETEVIDSGNSTALNGTVDVNATSTTNVTSESVVQLNETVHAAVDANAAANAAVDATVNATANTTTNATTNATATAVVNDTAIVAADSTPDMNSSTGSMNEGETVQEKTADDTGAIEKEWKALDDVTIDAVVNSTEKAFQLWDDKNVCREFTYDVLEGRVAKVGSDVSHFDIAVNVSCVYGNITNAGSFRLLVHENTSANSYLESCAKIENGVAQNWLALVHDETLCETFPMRNEFQGYMDTMKTDDSPAMGTKDWFSSKVNKHSAMVIGIGGIAVVALGIAMFVVALRQSNEDKTRSIIHAGDDDSESEGHEEPRDDRTKDAANEEIFTIEDPSPGAVASSPAFSEPASPKNGNEQDIV